MRLYTDGPDLGPGIAFRVLCCGLPICLNCATTLSRRCLWNIRVDMSSRHRPGFMLRSQCLCDIFILMPHRLLKLSMPTPERWFPNTAFLAQIFFPVFLMPVNDTAVLVARDLEISLVLLLYPLCRRSQCILWSVLFFSHLLSQP